MKNSFFSRFTPKEPKFFPLLKQLSEILLSSSALLIEILGHDSPEKRAEDYKRIKDLEREGDKLTNLILDELGTTFITPFDREDIHDPLPIYRFEIGSLQHGISSVSAVLSFCQ